MVKTVRSISLEVDEWKFLEEKANLEGKNISEIISDLIQKEIKNKEVNKHENG